MQSLVASGCGSILVAGSPQSAVAVAAAVSFALSDIVTLIFRSTDPQCFLAMLESQTSHTYSSAISSDLPV